jgi:DNA-binding ferritin-like protein
VPNRVTRFFMSLIGKSWAYDSAEDVREAIAKKSFDSLAERARTHTEGAAGLIDSFAFQSGLIELHDELHDAWHYLVALKARAREMGYGALAEHLDAAAETTAATLSIVATAAEATVPGPEVPVANR